jgi:hypothetical protein
MKSNGYLSSFFPLTSFKIKEDAMNEMIQTQVSSTHLNRNGSVMSPGINEQQAQSLLIESPLPVTPVSVPHARVRTSNIATPTALSSLINFSKAIDVLRNISAAHSTQRYPVYSSRSQDVNFNESLVGSASSYYSFDRSEISRVNTRRVTITRRQPWRALPSPINMDLWGSS